MGLTLFSTYALNASWPLMSLKLKNWAWTANKQRYVLLIVAGLSFFTLGYLAIPLIILAYIGISLLWPMNPPSD